MTQWCVTHKGNVPDHEAQIIRGGTTGSGPVHPDYACHDCVRTHGLLPAGPGPALVVTGSSPPGTPT